MRLLLHLFVLSGILSLTLANNHSLHRHLLSRQSVDCLPIFLQYPSDSDVQCGGESTYVMPVCTCCPGGAIGCYAATDVCSVDALGNSLCCPGDEPNCGEEEGSAATTAPPSSSTTAYDYQGSAATSTQPDPGSAATSTQPAPGSAATSTQPAPGSAATSTQPDPGATPASSQNNPGSAATTSAVATVSHNGASTFILVELKSLVMIILLGLV
jgi:hypothetical protein